MYSVLLKGSSMGFFHSTNRLRQGDSITLFVIGMEALSCLINRATREGTRGGVFEEFLTGCRIRGRGGDGVQITHLVFANDTLVFCDASYEQMTFLSWLLMWFEAISGLRINLDRSEILPVGKVENVELLALELNCKMGALPSTYLGLLLGAPHKAMPIYLMSLMHMQELLD